MNHANERFDRGKRSLYLPFQESQRSALEQKQIAHSKLAIPSLGDEVEEYIIKCICGSAYDDGNTVYCDMCDTWQHTKCYYLDKHGNVPTKEELEMVDHFCTDCRPRTLNVEGAGAKLFLCKIEGCEHAHRNDGFQRRYDLLAHMKIVHGYPVSEPSKNSDSLSPSDSSSHKDPTNSQRKRKTPSPNYREPTCVIYPGHFQAIE